MGLYLSDKGLFVAANNPAGKQVKRVKATESIRCATEEDVFRALKLPFMPRSVMMISFPFLPLYRYSLSTLIPLPISSCLYVTPFVQTRHVL